MKTSRPSRRDSIYSAPVCGLVTFIWPMFSGLRAKAARSSPPLVFAIFALAAVALDALVVVAFAILPSRGIRSPFFGVRTSLFDIRTAVRKANRTIGFSVRGAKVSRRRTNGLPLARRRRLRNSLRDAPEFGEEFLAHLVAGGARGVRREIDGADRLARAVENRDGNRAEPLLEFLVHDGKSLLAVSADAIEQRLHVGDGIRRVGLDGDRPQAAPDFRAVKITELGAAERGVEGRQPAADCDRCRHDTPRRNARDVDDLDALQD